MHVLSVDIGWRHLAFAQMVVTNDALSIEAWEIVDLIADASVNVNEATTEDLVRLAMPALAVVVRRWAAAKPDVAYLESQPLGQMARNVKTKTLSHVLQALLLAEGIAVQFVSPKRKLLGMSREDPASYAGNKKFAIAASAKLLEDLGLGTWYAWFTGVGGKRDDLADALLQGYYAAKAALVTRGAKPRARVAGPSKKRKRDAHAEAEAAVAGDLEEKCTG